MLSERLRTIRTEHHLTQKDIADVLGIDRTTYTFYETGATTPSPSTLYKLSQIYHVTVGYLMGVEDNRPELRRPPNQHSPILSSGMDPIASLGREERIILMCFRLLDEENQKQALILLKKMAQESKGID